MRLLTSPLSVGTSCAASVTVTVSSIEPGSSARSTTTLVADVDGDAGATVFLKPDGLVLTLYVPTGRLGAA
jgi:hypothetical protein